MLNNNGSNKQQNRDTDERQLAAQPSFMLMMMMLMMVMLMMVMLMMLMMVMLVVVLAALTLLMVVMMNMCHNFDPLIVFGCKVTAHFAQLGCKVQKV